MRNKTGVCSRARQYRVNHAFFEGVLCEQGTRARDKIGSIMRFAGVLVEQGTACRVLDSSGTPSTYMKTRLKMKTSYKKLIENKFKQNAGRVHAFSPGVCSRCRALVIASPRRKQRDTLAPLKSLSVDYAQIILDCALVQAVEQVREDETSVRTSKRHKMCEVFRLNTDCSMNLRSSGASRRSQSPRPPARFLCFGRFASARLPCKAQPSTRERRADAT